MPLQKYIFEKRSLVTLGHDSNIFKELIETDLKRDLKKLEKEDTTVTLYSLKEEHYSLGRVIGWGFTAYTQLHLYKALCLMANYPDYFTEFVRDVAFWSSYDPTFTLPAIVMGLNYALLARSRHPFLVNVRQRWTPFSKAIFVLYGSGISMVLPQTYLISYLAFGTAHLVVGELQR